MMKKDKFDRKKLVPAHSVSSSLAVAMDRLGRPKRDWLIHSGLNE
jgi:hypothetical protein